MFSIMAKKSKKQDGRSEKDDVGCMWGLIHMFDFRRSPKLLAERSRRISGYSLRNDLKSSEDLLAIAAASAEEDSTEMIHGGRPSIKALIEEEMASIQPSKQIPSDQVGNLESCLGPTVLKSMELTDGSDIDLNLATSLMEIYRYHNECRNISSAVESGPISDGSVNENQTDPNNHNARVDQIPSSIQKALEDIAESVISHQFADEKHLTSNGAARSKQFVDALQLLSSNKDLFLKLLQDPNSQLLGRLQHLYTSLGNPKLEPSESEEEIKLPDVTSSVQQPEVSTTEPRNMPRRHNSFFKEDKLIMRKPSKLSDSPRGLSRIVILKPSPARSQNSLITSSASSSPLSNGSILQGQEDSNKVTHYFSLRELKRRLRLAISDNRKDHHLSFTDGVLRKVPHGLEDAKIDRRLVVESSSTSSASRDSSDSESSVQPSTSNKATRQEDCGPDTENDIGSGVGSFSYEEAKRHLSERVDNHENDGRSRLIHKSESLGRLISYCEADLASPRHNVEEEKNINPLQETTTESPLQKVEQDDDSTSIISPQQQNLESVACSTSILIDEKLGEVKTELGNAPFQDESASEESNQEEIKDAPSDVVDNLPLGCATENSSKRLTQENLDQGPLEGSEPASPLPINQDSAEDVIKETEQLNPLAVLESVTASVTTFPGSPENTSDKEGQPSPQSVLDSFLGDSTSPNHNTAKHDDLSIAYSRNLLKELDTLSVSPTSGNRSEVAILEDKEERFSFIRAVLDASELLTEEENSERWHLDDPLVDPSLFAELGVSYCLSDDAKLLFYCIDEILGEIRCKFFGAGPWVAFLNRSVRPAPLEANLIHEVAKRVDWLLSTELPSTLDELVTRDFEGGSWMDLRCVEALEVWDDIFDDMLEEMVFDLWL